MAGKGRFLLTNPQAVALEAILIAKGLKTEACEQWERALEQEPNHPAAGLYLRLAIGDTPAASD